MCQSILFTCEPVKTSCLCFINVFQAHLISWPSRLSLSVLWYVSCNDLMIYLCLLVSSCEQEMCCITLSQRGRRCNPRSARCRGCFVKPLKIHICSLHAAVVNTKIEKERDRLQKYSLYGVTSVEQIKYMQINDSVRQIYFKNMQY